MGGLGGPPATPAIVVTERPSTVRKVFAVTSFMYMEKMGEVAPQPKVQMKKAEEMGRNYPLEIPCVAQLAESFERFARREG